MERAVAVATACHCNWSREPNRRARPVVTGERHKHGIYNIINGALITAYTDTDTQRIPAFVYTPVLGTANCDRARKLGRTQQQAKPPHQNLSLHQCHQVALAL